MKCIVKQKGGEKKLSFFLVSKIFLFVLCVPGYHSVSGHDITVLLDKPKNIKDLVLAPNN